MLTDLSLQSKTPSRTIVHGQEMRQRYLLEGCQAVENENWKIKVSDLWSHYSMVTLCDRSMITKPMKNGRRAQGGVANQETKSPTFIQGDLHQHGISIQHSAVLLFKYP